MTSILVAIGFFLLPCARAEQVLESFPVTIDAGIALPAHADPDGGRVLPDLPFSSQRGYGYVGGRAGTRSDVAHVAGGRSHWTVSWRDDPRRYSLRVPGGEYLLELSWIETDVAGEGLRSFDVVCEGQTLLESVDVAGAVGDFAWLTLRRVVSVTDGWLDLELVAAPTSLPPRLSRLRVARAPASAAEIETPPRPGAVAYPSEVRLRWDGPATDVASAALEGYGVFRSESAGGPYEPLVAAPVRSARFVDRQVEPGKTYYYRLQAYSTRGAQSSLSEVLSVDVPASYPGELPVYHLGIAPAALRQLATRAAADRPVAARLVVREREYAVAVRALTDPRSWQARKSYEIRSAGGDEFESRERFLLLAEVGDPALLRERLFHEAHRRTGLAAPRAEPVHLVVAGRYAGVYLDREAIDDDFRKRTRLDRVGELCRLQGGGRLRTDWRPYGRPLDGEGSTWNLTQLVHELNRLDPGEEPAFFEERFYFDRLVDRLALAAILGRRQGEVEERVVLGDSRNGKWEFFTRRAPRGALGIDLAASGAGETELDVAWSLNGGSLFRRSLPASDWQALETRFFAVPSLRMRYLDRIRELYDELWSETAIRDAIEKLGLPPSRVGLEKEVDSVLAHYRAHRRALLDAVELERAAAGEPVVISELLLAAPQTDGKSNAHDEVESSEEGRATGWVEILNRSDRSVSLGDYDLSIDPVESVLWRLPDRELGPREHLVVGFAGGQPPRANGAAVSTLDPSPRGGLILLSRRDARGRRQVRDVVFYGHQTAGISVGRTDSDAGSSRWGKLPAPSPGEPAGETFLEAPPWRYRWRIERTKDDELRIWAQPAGEVERLELRYRPGEEEEFRSVRLPWNDRLFRYELVLPRGDGPLEVPFYFLARSGDGVERPYPLTGAALPFSIPGKLPLFINEVLPRPGEGNPHGEFVEIYNAGDRPISVEGMFLSDSRENPRKWRVPLEEPIPPRGFALVYADGAASGRHAPFKLGNSGEYLGLFHRLECGNVRIDHIAYNAVPTDMSWGRRKDGRKGGRIWKDPTPGARNMPKIPEEYLESRRSESDGARRQPIPDETPGDAGTDAR